MEDALRVVELWEERLAWCCRDSLNFTDARETKVQLPPYGDIAGVSSGGLAMLTLLLEMYHSEGDVSSCGEGAAQVCGRARELLAQALVALVELWVHEAGVEAEVGVGVVCLSLEAASSQEGLPETLRRWWDLEVLVERGWRWCEAHLTLRPSDELARHGPPPRDVAGLTEWWWRPEAISATDSPPTLMSNVWPLFKDVIEMVSEVPNSDSLYGGLKVATELLQALEVANDYLFTHRIAVSRSLLQRLYTAKAQALLHQAHLLSCLSFVKNIAIGPYHMDRKKTPKIVDLNNDHELLWVSCEGLQHAWWCLIAAMTAVQVATAEFGASCDSLRSRIRRALFGTLEYTLKEEGVSLSGDKDFFVHSLAELCENSLRIIHGVGFISTGKISEGEVILKERPLFSLLSQFKSIESDKRSDELLKFTSMVLEVFQRSGILYMNSLVLSEIVKTLRNGALFGDFSLNIDIWIALHLLIFIPKVKNNCSIEGNNFKIEFADIVRSLQERFITIYPLENFKIQQCISGDEGKALYPLGSFINHSCKPNALRFFNHNETERFPSESKELYIIALRDIQPGEEITVSYLPSLLIPRNIKQTKNGFCCRCTFCQSHNAFLEGVVCPECKKLIYDDDDNDKDEDNKPNLSKTIHVDPFSEGSVEVKGNVLLHRHSIDCIHGRSVNYKNLLNQISQTFREVLRNIRLEFLGNNKDEKENNLDENDRYALRAQKAMRQLINLNNFSNGLPSTHYYRLKARMECLAVSLNAKITFYDNVQLLQLCEELLEDLELILPRNYPLITGIRLHYCLIRSRYITSSLNIDDENMSKEGEKCCGALREQAEMMRLPFIKDSLIREFVIKSFQEYNVQTGWKFSEFNEHELLQSFLEYYTEELFMCGIDGIPHLDMISLMCDTTQENNTDIRAYIV